MYDGLPFAWRGQEIKEIGSIVPLPHQVQKKPVPLPEGLEWVSFDINNFINDVLWEYTHHPMREVMFWITLHPSNPCKRKLSYSSEDNWAIAIKNKDSNKIMGGMLWYSSRRNSSETVPFIS